MSNKNTFDNSDTFYTSSLGEAHLFTTNGVSKRKKQKTDISILAEQLQKLGITSKSTLSFEKYNGKTKGSQAEILFKQIEPHVEGWESGKQYDHLKANY